MSLNIGIHAYNPHRLAAFAKAAETTHWVTIWIDRTASVHVHLDNAEEAAILAACLNDIQARRDAAREVAA